MAIIIARFNNQNEFLYVDTLSSAETGSVEVAEEYKSSAISSEYWHLVGGVVTFKEADFKKEVAKQTIDRLHTYLDTKLNTEISFDRDGASSYFGGYGYKGGWDAVLRYTKDSIYSQEATKLISLYVRLKEAGTLIGADRVNESITTSITDSDIDTFYTDAKDNPSKDAYTLFKEF